MTDEQFDALCEANSFGAVARSEFPLVPQAMLKALVDAAVTAEREACLQEIREVRECIWDGLDEVIKKAADNVCDNIIIRISARGRA